MCAVPIINGVVIDLPEYNAQMRSDMYKIADVFVFIGSMDYKNTGKPDLRVLLAGNSMDRDSSGYRLLIVESHKVDPITDEGIDLKYGKGPL